MNTPPLPGSRPPLLTSLRWPARFLLLLWFILLTDNLFGLNLSHYGIYPRSWQGLIGILTAPLIHSSPQHLAANSLPVLVLGAMLLFGYPGSRWRALLIIWLTTGCGVWLFGRQSFHIGASGLAHGLFFYLLTISLLRRDSRSIVLMMLAFMLFGGMLLTVLPGQPGVSFESHLAGAVGGVIAAWRLRNLDPKPLRKRYSWEEEEAGEETGHYGLLRDDVAPPHQAARSAPRPSSGPTSNPGDSISGRGNHWR